MCRQRTDIVAAQCKRFCRLYGIAAVIITDKQTQTDCREWRDSMDNNGSEEKCMKECCCCGRKKERTADEYKKLINRLNRIEGQIRGIKGMIEKDAYCTDILVQSAAVSAAMNAFNRELLANHIRTCVADDIRKGNDEVIDDLVATLQKLMK